MHFLPLVRESRSTQHSEHDIRGKQLVQARSSHRSMVSGRGILHCCCRLFCAWARGGTCLTERHGRGRLMQQGAFTWHRFGTALHRWAFTWHRFGTACTALASPRCRVCQRRPPSAHGLPPETPICPVPIPASLFASECLPGTNGVFTWHQWSGVRRWRRVRLVSKKAAEAVLQSIIDGDSDSEVDSDKMVVGLLRFAGGRGLGVASDFPEPASEGGHGIGV